MPTPLRVVQYGLGPIGQATARAVLDKQEMGHMTLVGAVDIDPVKVGTNVGELVGAGESATDVRVSDDADWVLESGEPDVVLHTTSSFVEDVEDQLLRCIHAGVDVVSSTEELAFPFERHPERAEALDRAAQEAGVVIVGTGVNPGYAMDTLPLMATGVCTNVDAVHVERVVDAGERRGPLQEKVGAGISTESFAEKKAAGGFGHIGLRESLLMVADGLGWTLDTLEENLEAVTADDPVETGHRSVESGDVAGIHHAARGIVDRSEVITLDLKMYVGAEHPRDTITVEGTPPINLNIAGGIFGDTATTGMLVNVAARVSEASPGLRSMMDLPIPRALGTMPNVT